MDFRAHSPHASDDPDTFCTINVQVLLSLPPAECDTANSGKKTFKVNGIEYPMSRFGSWVFRASPDEASKREYVNEGGIAAAIVWAVYQGYNNLVTAWVSDCSKNSFVFEVRKSDWRHILEEITGEKMASAMEGVLRSMADPSYCENMQIKLIKIVQDSDKKVHPGDVQNRMDPESFDQLNMERLHQAEVIARHMKSKQYTWALPILKQSLVRENDETSRLQLLIRTYICAAYLKSEKEMEECLPRLVITMKLATIPPSEISLYSEEYRDLFELLLSHGSTVRALEIGLTFQSVIAKIPDVAVRLEARANNIQQLCKAIKSLLQINPGVCLKAQARTYIKKVHDEIDLMKKEPYCDSLAQAQCVYYCEFALAEVRKSMDRRIAEVFSETSVEFKRLSSCWADFPFVVTRLRQHPKISKYLADEEFIRTLRKISMKPSLLEKHLKEPKIAEAHEVLASEFGLLDSIAKEDSADKVAEENSNNGEKNIEKEPVDKKAAAQREKEMGNDAYKTLDFEKAHQHYDKAIQYDPDDALLHSNKAAVFISQKNLEMAKRACLFALNVAKKDIARFSKKDHAKITARLAKAEFLDGRRDIALLLYQQSLALCQDPKIFEEMKKCQESILNNMTIS